MTKPKNMTPEQELAFKERVAAHQNAYYEANKDRLLANHKDYRESNKDILLAKKKLYEQATREKISAKKKEWRKKTRNARKTYLEVNKEKISARLKAQVEELKPYYVADLLGIKLSECPPALIEMKRQQILIYRSIKQLNNKLEKQNGSQ